MKALTIRQPWAQLIIEGHKDIENRDWPTRVRGRIAVHASANLSKAEIGAAMEMLCLSTKTAFSFDLCSYWSARSVLGSIIGTVEIVDCVSQSDSSWFVGDYGFLLRNPIQLATPIPLKGALGFWDVPAEIAQQLTKARTA